MTGALRTKQLPVMSNGAQELLCSPDGCLLVTTINDTLKEYSRMSEEEEHALF